ncbi:MAG: transcriptional regulator [Thermosphaera sp.]
MKSFCEVYNRKILPAVRMYLSRKLVLDYNLSQLDAAKILGLKQSLVNYAVTGRRRSKYFEVILGFKDFRRYLDDLAVEMSTKKYRGPYVCDLCQFLMRTNLADEVLKAVEESPSRVYKKS